jgi:SAM-dependent methyltransferase
MSIFQQYAEVYDACYQDKDYDAEAKFVLQLISRYGSTTQTILDLGCGTGRHTFEFAKEGFNVLGVDSSPQMIAKAKAKANLLPSNILHFPNFLEADVTCFSCSELWDVAVSLFQVINYHVTNEKLLGAFRSVGNALKPGGLFIFDFWYGPAVLTERPTIRIKHVETSEARIIRLAEPVIDVNRNVVDVNYTLLINETNSNTLTEIHERHSIRFLFLPEIELLASAAGFEIIETGEWLTSKPLHDHCWSGYAVARAMDSQQ